MKLKEEMLRLPSGDGGVNGEQILSYFHVYVCEIFKE